MSERITDPRFSYIEKDPRFRPVPKNERKIKIDKRFKGMFKDDKFKVKYSVDKRGKPANYTSTENLKKFYELSSSEEDSSDQESTEFNAKSPQKSKCLLLKTKVSSIDNDSKLRKDELSDEEKSSNEEEENESLTESKSKDDQKFSVDYSRGKAVLESSSSDDDTSEDEAVADLEIEHPWGEIDKDAERGDDESNRLALCNMDWDRIKADDLFLLFSSFLPKNGVLKSVIIYPSDFGLERMKEDDLKGPAELRSECPVDSQTDKGGAANEDEFSREKLRSYQIKRLKYFYAVIECDTVNTANAIYKECDGMEYESSAAKIDLRFIPDDVTFDDREPKDSCFKTPDPSKYQPRCFINTALQQINVKLTWDETNPDMIEATRQAFRKNGNVQEERLLTYVASGESESEEEVKVEDTDVTGDHDPISKYRSLLAGLGDGEKEDDVEMEISWEPGLEKKAAEIVENKMKPSKEVTPWEQYLEKRKEKKRAKRREKRQGKGDVSESEEEQNEEELQLLVMDQEEEKHFDLKKLVNKKGEAVKDENETFQVNVEDPRFGKIYTSHLYNIDPSDPQYKKTKGMEAFVDKKLKRYREEGEDKEVPPKKSAPAAVKSNDAELSSLVKSIKSKASTFKNKRKK